MNAGQDIGTVFNLFWFLFIFFFAVWPFWKRSLLNREREAMIRLIEKKYNARVITMIHRQEGLSFFGFAFMKFINIEDSEQVLRAIRMTPEDMPIVMILHTPGGLALAASQIASALARHKSKVMVIVPHYAMSGGTLIALSADEIVMDHNAVLGPVDPQIGQLPAASILKVLEVKKPEDIDDETMIMADVSKKAIEQMKSFVYELLKRKGQSDEIAKKIAEDLSTGKFTHDYPLDVNQLKAMGLNINTDVPEEVYELMELYDQPTNSQVPSVQYIPIPYKTAQQKK
ncbi:MAG: SDH family Clp fold serine proteinase [Hydrogenobaculum sp.]